MIIDNQRLIEETGLLNMVMNYVWLVVLMCSVQGKLSFVFLSIKSLSYIKACYIWENLFTAVVLHTFKFNSKAESNLILYIYLQTKEVFIGGFGA